MSTPLNHHARTVSHQRVIEIEYDGDNAHLVAAAIGAKIVEAVYAQEAQLNMLEHQMNRQAALLEQQFGQGQAALLEHNNGSHVPQLNGRKVNAQQ